MAVAFLTTQKHRPPGFFIARLDDESRSILRGLTSDMLGTMRGIGYYGRGHYDLRPREVVEIEEALLRFDREVLKLPPARLRPHHRGA